MFAIKSIAVDHFRIPLPLASTDSTHGEIAHFCLIAGRLTDARGREGRDYTYIVDNIAAAATRQLIGQGSCYVYSCLSSVSIEGFCEEMCWHVHFVGRGGLAVFPMAAAGVAL